MKEFRDKVDNLKQSGKPIQVHLGCGKRCLPDFLHFDNDAFEHVDVVGNVATLASLENNEVDLIYACHILEYWDQIEVQKVLKEWLRVLKPNGILRLSVPDFDKVIEIYQKEKDMKLLYGFLYGRYSTQKEGPFIYHRMIYTYESLKEALLDAGFKSMERYNWEDTIHVNHDDYSQAYLPHMDKENGTMMSLNVEAQK